MNCKTIIGLCLSVVCVFVSCKKELEPQESTSVADTATVVETAAPAVQAAQPDQPMPQQMQSGQPMVAPTQQKPAPVAKGMNPAHGQPGHRCEIPVGAPLNSTPAAKSQPVTITPQSMQTKATQAPAILNPAQAPAPVVTAPGMNPPHGQDGHRCDISVGAPLIKK